MSSSIVVPTLAAEANYPPAIAAAVVALATQAQNDINGIDTTLGTLQNWTTKSSSFNAAAGNYFVDLSGGAVTATMPASPSAGTTIAFKDHTENAATHNLTVSGNGNQVEGQNGGFASSQALSTNGFSVTYVFAPNNKWVLV